MNSLYAFLRAQILPLEEIDNAIPRKGHIVDLGCGQGLIATYLSNKPGRNVLGVDANSKRLPANKSNNLQFKKADITTLKLKSPITIILSDVLHHLSVEKQNKLINNSYKNLKIGGLLIIKEIDTDEWLRSRLSRLWDMLIYPKDKISFRSSNELTLRLKKTGFKLTVSRPCRLFPGSTTLYICKK